MIKKALKNKLLLTALASTLIFSSVGTVAYAESVRTTSNITIGQELTQPEAGWKRYDDADPNISYEGSWERKTKLWSAHNDATTWNPKGDFKIKFDFIGSKIRLIAIDTQDRTKENIIKIDGVTYKFKGGYSSGYQKLLFEKKGLEFKQHHVEIQNAPHKYFDFDAVDIDNNGELKPFNIRPSKISLNKSSITLQVEQTETLVATISPKNVINKNVIWSSSDSNIVTVDQNGNIAAVNLGTATITAKTEDGNLDATCEVIVNNLDKIVLDLEPGKEKIHIAEEVTADLIIDNIKEIAAEDIRIKYDSEKLEYLECDEVDGMKLVIEDNKEAGELRFIVASKGEENIVNTKEVLLKLHFKGIKEGEALVDIVKGRVSDGIEMEKDLDENACDETTIIIEGLEDVNGSGEFTLLDLGIDARHFDKDPNSKDLEKYNTDIVVNDAIDEDDLLEIGRLILANDNYEPNNN